MSEQAAVTLQGSANSSANHENESGIELGHSPSERDRAIYQAVCIDCRSAAAVAQEFHLAATTVRNIAQETQRKLARRQHELDRRTTCEALEVYYDQFASQVEQLHDAWRASREEAETIQRTTTRIGRPAGDESGSVAALERIVEKETATLRKQPRGDFRCMALANRILRDMRAIEAEYKVERRRERAEAARQALPPDEQKMQSDRELAALKSQPPPPGCDPEARRTFERTEGGPWKETTRPRKPASSAAPALPAAPPPPPPPPAPPMSRREQKRNQHRRGDAPMVQPVGVSAVPQAAGGQAVAAQHLRPE